jgi:hypothetical protein
MNIFSFLGFNMQDFNQREKVVGTAVEHIQRCIEKKHHLKMIGIGSSQKDHKQTMIGLSFQKRQILTKNDCRKLIIECTEEILNLIHEDENLQKHLAFSPFSVENLEIRIFIVTPEGGDVFDPDIEVVSLINGIIAYKTVNPENHYQFKSTEKETYQEALQILQKQTT